MRGLRRAYGGVPAVDGVDLTIAPGEVVALLGSTGAGKSTVVDTLLGLTRPDAATADPVGLAGLPDMSEMRVEGSRIHLTCDDSGLAVRALLAARPDAADLEVVAHGLQDAFVRITRS